MVWYLNLLAVSLKTWYLMTDNCIGLQVNYEMTMRARKWLIGQSWQKFTYRGSFSFMKLLIYRLYEHYTCSTNWHLPNTCSNTIHKIISQCTNSSVNTYILKIISITNAFSYFFFLLQSQVRLWSKNEIERSRRFWHGVCCSGKHYEYSVWLHFHPALCKNESHQ